jgi:tRNA modification GTPase
MPFHQTETISAVATPPGEGALGIVRISGSEAFAIAGRLFKTRRHKPFESHRIYFGQLIDPAANGEAIDHALLLTFRAPHSYTGEDVIEFSCHGGSAILQRVLQLTWQYGARPAMPGEFTQRAFLNGKMDLAQAEAVADLIHARTHAQHRAALALHEGMLSKQVRSLADSSLSLLAQVEAVIDFSEEIGELDFSHTAQEIQGVLRETQSLIRQAQAGRMLREGVRLAIIGRPNVGKSSLLNRLVGEERAIVTEIPGTTRDVIEEGFSLHGVPVVVMDTAGVRESGDLVEQIGIERARKAIEQADVLVVVLSAPEGITEEDEALLQTLPEKPCLIVWNKIDLSDASEYSDLSTLPALPTVPISALTGQGIDQLKEALAEQLQLNAVSTESLLITHARHANALQEAAHHLEHALETIDARLPADFLSIDLRGAWQAFGQITGETVSEAIIERIFRDFCIGK